MSGLFQAIEIGRQALWAQQQGALVSSQNIANANTDGYSRRRAVLRSQAGPSGGVRVDDLQRLRESFTDEQFRSETAVLKDWEARHETLRAVEDLFNEPSESGFSAALDQFWNGWHQLSQNPSSTSARSLLLERARALAHTVRHIDERLISLRDEVLTAIEANIGELNQLGGQIARLNQQIVRLKAAGSEPHALMDERDELLDQIAERIEVSVQHQDNGAVRVRVPGGNLVVGQRASTLAWDAENRQVIWADQTGAQPLPVRGGRIGGLMAVVVGTAGQPGQLETYRNQLAALAADLSKAVNEQHAKGFDSSGDPGAEFFSMPAGGAARDLRLDPDLTVDTVAAAGTDPGGSAPAAGDGANATAMARLQDGGTFNNGEAFDLADAFERLIGDLGVNSQSADNMRQNQSALVSSLELRRLSETGVSLNEEMTLMTQYQQAFQAAGQVVRVSDQMLQTVIGLVR